MRNGGNRLRFPPLKTGAAEESRTLDLNLGKVALYQLSYCRERVEIVAFLALSDNRDSAASARNAAENADSRGSTGLRVLGCEIHPEALRAASQEETAHHESINRVARVGGRIEPGAGVALVHAQSAAALSRYNWRFGTRELARG